MIAGAVLLVGAGALLLQQVEQAQINSDKKILYGASTPYVAQVRSHPTALDRPGGEERLVVLDPAGSARVSNLPDAISDRLPELHRLSSGSHFASYRGTRYLLVVRKVERSDGVWRIVAARDESSTTDIVMRNLTNIIVVGGVALLAGFGVASWVLTTVALRPVTLMRRRAETLEAIGSDEQLPVGRAQDELSALAVTLNAFLARVRASAAREKQVVADASHELRTPIAVLRGQLELAKRDPGDLDRLREIDETAARLSNLAVNLLVLSTLEADTTRPTSTWPQLVDEFAAATDRARMLATPAGAEIDFDVERPDGDGSYAISATDLGRVIDNLVRNALAAGGAGTTIRGSLARTATLLELRIEDDGPGIPDDFIATAADRFTRASPATEGAGLGLAIVRRIADRAAGSLELANREPHGLRVTLGIPAAETFRRAARPSGAAVR
ncbi:sensor histidine kinase [Pseudolysinimonas kribbensis]|uniref:sensor histidine kinase n=1 Tax=Pseudolysinimonas kribbensis TaxID=433641 RepID=UPI0024E1075F|nr:HAMP domain-containing sensor histidine kinase [Pseudolysinimonas kribbensis]